MNPTKGLDVGTRYPGWSVADAANSTNPRAKYGNQRTEYNGHMYDSKAEAEYAERLDWRERAGEVRNVRRQHRIALYAYPAASSVPPGVDVRPQPVTYRPSGRLAHHVVDFAFDELVYLASGARLWVARYVEVKGVDTPVGKLKRAIVEAMLGVAIEVIRR